MKLAIFGGSFNPIHIGHLWLTQQVYETGEFDKLWIMPNFSGKSSGKTGLESAENRMVMCHLALEDIDQRFGCDETLSYPVIDIEVLFGYEYTDQTVNHILKFAPKFEITWIISSDWNVEEFKNYDELKTKCDFFIVHRPGNKNDGYYGNKRNFLSMNFELSSSQIRDRVKNGKHITGLVTPSVEKYILEKGLYK